MVGIVFITLKVDKESGLFSFRSVKFEISIFVCCGYSNPSERYIFLTTLQKSTRFLKIE